MPKLQGLIYDLDGTLVDSAPDLCQALNAMLEEFGRRPLSLKEATAMTGDGMMPLVTRAFEATGGVPQGFNSYATFQIFIKYYRSLKADPAQIYPDVVNVLENFAAKNIKSGVCTNKQEAATLRILDELNLSRFFSFVAGGDTFPVHKPNPGHVTGVIERLGVTADHCVMIGDSSNDVRAAQGAGIPCIVVTHGYGGDYEALGGDRLIPGFRQLPEALAGLGFDFG